MNTFVNILVTVVIFIILFGLIIFIHELGHFLAAKKAGVYVQEFAFGFGPRIWGKKWRGTEYKLNLIPLGGYCKMLGDQDGSGFLRYHSKKYNKQDETFSRDLFKQNKIDLKKDDYATIEAFVNWQKEELSQADYTKLQNFMVYDYIPNHPGNFDNIPKLKKAGVIVAGVVMNFILAIVLFYIYFFITGFYTDIRKLGEPWLIGVESASPPYLSFLYTTDNANYADSMIIKANGQLVYSQAQFQQILRENYNKPVKYELQKLSENSYSFIEADLLLNGDGYPSNFDEDLVNHPVITQVDKGSLAENLHLEVNDVILELAGEQVNKSDSLATIFKTNEGKNVTLTYLDTQGIEHKAEFLDPITEPGKTILGIAFYLNDPYPGYILRLNYNNDKLFSGLAHTVNMAVYNFTGIYELIKESVQQKSLSPVSEGVSSVVGVSDVVYSLVKVNDFTNIINLTALVSLSLGVMNLLPIPLFDGGHLMFLIIEKIRGRKISPRNEERISVIAFYSLIIISILIIFKDIFQLQFINRIINLITGIFH